MNAQEYAQHRGVSKMTVSKWIRHGKISAIRVGREYEIDPAVADQQLTENINQAQQRKPKTEESTKPISSDEPLVADAKPKKGQAIGESMKGGPSFAEAQRAREVYRAERERLRLLQEKGELVVASDVKKEVTTLMRTVRDNMMSIPDRVASQLAALTDIHEVHHLLDDEIRTALRMLANG
jgi:excisionase family DNA binding protein